MPQKLEHIINRALEKDRELRYQSAKEMRSELMRLKRDRESGRSSATSTSLGTAELSSAARAGSLEIAAAVLKTGRPKSIGGKGWAVGGFSLVLALLVYFHSRPLSPPKVSGYASITHNGSQKDLVGTDGARLYFNEYASTGVGISLLSCAGGEVARVSVPGLRMSLLAVSPNGAELLGADGVGCYTGNNGIARRSAASRTRAS